MDYDNDDVYGERLTEDERREIRKKILKKNPCAYSNCPYLNNSVCPYLNNRVCPYYTPPVF